MSQFSDFVYWGFLALLTGMFAISLKLIGDGVKTLSELNVKIAIILERLGYHETRIKSIENKLDEKGN